MGELAGGIDGAGDLASTTAALAHALESLDHLVGHKTPELLFWLFSQGILPLCTPLGGSWLNMAESIQHILKRRALDGQHPSSINQLVVVHMRMIARSRL